MIDPSRVALFIPPELKDFKLKLFERIGAKIEALGGRTVKKDHNLLEKLPLDIIPIVGCSIQLRGMIGEWKKSNRDFIYWDRGYCRRVFATWLPKGENGGYYRWHLNSFQMRKIRTDLSNDRWKTMRTELKPWEKIGRHIVIAAPSKTYAKFHGCEDWVRDTVHALARSGTKRQVVIRDKESKRPLNEDLLGAHALVTHGSNSAVESVFFGCPVFVDQSSAASLIGSTSLDNIEKPIYPDREHWLRSLCYSQFNETELVDGTLWKLIT